MRLNFIIIFFLCLYSWASHAKVLTATDVVNLTYQQSPQAQSISLMPEISQYNVMSARSQYDTTINTNVTHNVDRTERISPVFGTETTTTNFDTTLTQLTPSGTAVEFGFLNTRNTSDSPFVTARELFESRLSLTLVQPILRNYFGHITRRNIELAKEQYNTAIYDTQSQLLDLAYRNLNLYWNWFLQHEFIQLEREAIQLSRDILDANLKRLDLGLIERVDLYGFHANLNFQESELLVVEENLAQLSNDLKANLNLPFEERLTPSYQSLPGNITTLSTLLTTALADNPALKTIQTDLKAHNIAVAMQKNAKLPQLDLIGSLQLNGLDTTYGQAVQDIRNVNPLVTAGASFQFPLQNRQARAEHQRLLLIKKQKLLGYQQAENQISSLVRQSYARYEMTQKRMQLVREFMRNQKLKWEEEISRYNQARSSSDIVIRFQNDYVNARKMYLQTQVAHQLAKTDLLYAQGKLK